MMSTSLPLATLPLLPAALMLAAPALARLSTGSRLWRGLQLLAGLALLAALLSLGLQLTQASEARPTPLPGLATSLTAAWVAVLVQGLGLVIAVFSSRYLEGEPGQPRYVAALGGVLASVHLLLLADHWLVLIAAWAAVGLVLQRLLCFYADRPFALLAAHKKRLADRLADVLLIAAAALAWHELGTGSLSELRQQLQAQAGPTALALQASAVCLVLAVMLRTALLPVHGWLIQVMEAPTPVSALLHAGVVNLGGVVLIRLAPLLEAAPLARWLLVGAGLATAVLAGLAMLTRVSIKLRLAWSTVAQMGFMLMECGLGLYTLALLHLLGHSLYKAHSFLAASGAMDDTRSRLLRGPVPMASTASLIGAPMAAGVLLGVLMAAAAQGLALSTWPAWWTALLALAWAPLLWQRSTDTAGRWQAACSGAAMVLALGATALLGHQLPLGVQDSPDHAAGLVALAGMALLYVVMALIQRQHPALAGWRRRSYAGFYADELITRAALRLWPTRWTPSSAT